MLQIEMVVSLLVCLCILSLGSVAEGSVASLPQSEEKLVQLAESSKLTLPGNESRIFPNISFSCNGSVVGWSLVAPRHVNGKGLRPILNIRYQNRELNPRLYLQRDSVTMLRCLKTTISREKQLYLYETAITPMNFYAGDVVGMLVRNKSSSRTVFTPYMTEMNNFTAYYRQSKTAKPRETVQQNKSDSLMPLLFLHVCFENDSNYDDCIQRHVSRIKSNGCLVEPSPSPSPSPEPSAEENDNSEGSMTLVYALAIPFSLALLVLVLLLVFALVYIGLTRRKRKESEKTVVAHIDTPDARNEAQPYAEPILLSSRTSTPLPPPPNHPPPPPTHLGFQQPTYAVLSGPTPSPPPPYVLSSDTNRPPRIGDLPSPEYESIDGQERKAALLRQNATETSLDSVGYSKLGPTSNDYLAYM